MLAIQRFAAETVSVFGDNGLAAEAAACQAAAEKAGPVPLNRPTCIAGA